MWRKLLKWIGRGVLALVLTVTAVPALLGVLLVVFGVFSMVPSAIRSIPFDVEKHGVVDVIVQDYRDDGGEWMYYALSHDGRAQEVDPFEPDGMTVIEVIPDSLECYIDREQNKVLNRLAEVQVYDEHGKAVNSTDPLVDAIMRQAAKLEHNLFTIRIMKVGDAAFLYTELNVNWWTPCELYYYDPAADRLIELYTFDGKEVVGLRVRNVGKLYQSEE